MSEEINPYAVICRGCLRDSGEMKNMYEWGLADDFYVFADVTMERSERLTEMLCTSCEEALVTSRNFRTQCQRSDAMLKSSLASQSTLNTPMDSSNAITLEITSALQENNLIICISTNDMDSKLYLPCLHKCGNQYQKKKDLIKHLNRAHGQDLSVQLRYYCVVDGCSYNVMSGKTKHFTERKFLNQHINKVHKTKDYNCQKCSEKFSTIGEWTRHNCEMIYVCEACCTPHKTHERLMVHLLRRHPDLHEQYKKRKTDRNAKRSPSPDSKKLKKDAFTDYTCDSPKRSFATQTFLPDIRNDVTLTSCQNLKSEDFDRNHTTIQTQTVFEDLLSLKSQNSEDSLFFAESVSLSDIQTQTFPIEFGLSSKKTSETQTKDDLMIKETQTCFCFCESPKMGRLLDSVSSSPSNLTSTQTQTLENARFNLKSDVLLSFNSAETQTSFEDKKQGF